MSYWSFMSDNSSERLTVSKTKKFNPTLGVQISVADFCLLHSKKLWTQELSLS